MADTASAQTGAVASLRALGSTLLDAVGTRAELAVVELREEAQRRQRMLVLALVAAVFLGLAILAGSFLVVAIFWDTHRLAAAALVTAFHGAVGVAAVVALKRAVRDAPAPFHATLAELARDREMLARRRTDVPRP